MGFFYYYFFFLPFQLASIFHPKRRAGGGGSAGRGQRSAEINGRCFVGGAAGDDDADEDADADDDGVPRDRGDPCSPSLRWGTGGEPGPILTEVGDGRWDDGGPLPCEGKRI